MKSKVTIVGLTYEFEELDIGRSKSFPGAGGIKATAISRMSKNRYKVYVILDWSAVDVVRNTVRDAVEYLQRMYDKYGKIPNVGDYEEEKDESESGKISDT